MEMKSRAWDLLEFLGGVIGSILAIAFTGFVLKIFYNVFMFGWDLI
jgi:hypothetical protein